MHGAENHPVDQISESLYNIPMNSKKQTQKTIIKIHLNQTPSIMFKFVFYLLPLMLLFSCAGQPRSTVVLNPYEDVDWSSFEKHKANLHTHTTESDGSFSPLEVVTMFSEAGYTILALTDHDNNKLDQPTWPWENYGIDISNFTILPVQGNEISSTNHIGSYFNDYSDGSQTSEILALEEIGQRDGLAVMFHPGRYRNQRNAQFYFDLYQTYDHLVGMEVVNKRDVHSADRILYDSVLSYFMPDRPVWAFSNDDFHRLEHFGTSYNIFLLPKNGLQTDQFRNAFENGHFFAVHDPSETWSKAVIPDSVIVSDRKIIVYADCDEEQVQWISQGYIVHTGKSLPLSMNLGSYVRVNIAGEDNAFTLLQPFGLSPLQPLKTAKLDVKNGSTSADDYIAGAQNIRIQANKAPKGKIFERWVGDDAKLVKDIYAENTLIMLPKPGAYSIEAGYRDAQPYLLTVVNGLGGGMVREDEIVFIEASVAEGRKFDYWKGDTLHVHYPWSAWSKITMPAHDTKVEAVFIDEYICDHRLKNTSFDQQMKHWRVTHNQASVQKTERDGVENMVMVMERRSGIAQFIFKDVELKKGQRITLYFDAKVVPDSEGFYHGSVGVQNHDADGRELMNPNVDVEYENWRTYSVSWIAPEGTTSLSSWAWMRNGQLFLDNFCLRIH